MTKTKRELEEAQGKLLSLQEARDIESSAQREAVENADSVDSTAASSELGDSHFVKEECDIKKELEDDSTADEGKDDGTEVKKEKSEIKKEAVDVKPDAAALAAVVAKAKDQKNADSEIIRDLKAQLK